MKPFVPTIRRVDAASRSRANPVEVRLRELVVRTTRYVLNSVVLLDHRRLDAMFLFQRQSVKTV